MDYYSLPLMLGLNPSNFVNKVNEPIRTERGFIYKIEQKSEFRFRPHCRSKDAYVHSYRITDTLRVKKVRFKSRECGKTFYSST